ncbi:MAG: DUF3142 domain-containing protein [Candidatus Hydrogenedentes bacterium]|nr:DUF3142 domain-containing protein [Candidatus Hydrogenedentota bacterium]
MVKRRTYVLYLAIVLVVLASTALGLHLRRQALTGPPRDLEQTYYVWQMQWTDSVREAVREAAPGAAQVMVLLGEINSRDDALALTAAQPDWKTLSEARVRVTLVLRANVGLGSHLSGERRAKTADYLAGVLKGAQEKAQAAGVEVAGLQLDYDCPSSKLGDYRGLLDALRERHAATQLSITVLPTWLRRWEFANLVDRLSYYVLQVHSLEPPENVDSPIMLCDTARIPGYLRKAASVGVPFYLALPTYGYRFAFDAEGRFKALSAEGPQPAWAPSFRVKLAMTDPEEIAAVVRSIQEAPPRACLGFAWFRLPVSSDELNWTWPTLQAVSQGRVPETALRAEVRNPSPGLYEVWLANAGETRVWKAVAFDVTWEGHRLVAHDLLGGFEGQPDSGETSLRAVGPAPRGSEPSMVAWLRVEEATVPGNVVRVGPVEVME